MSVTILAVLVGAALLVGCLAGALGVGLSRIARETDDADRAAWDRRDAAA